MSHSNVHMSVFLCSENRMFCIPSLADNTWTDKSSSSGKGSVAPRPRGEVQSLGANSSRDGEINGNGVILCKIFKDQEWALGPFMGSEVEGGHKSVSHTTSWDAVGRISVPGTQQAPLSSVSVLCAVKPFFTASWVWLELLLVEHHLTDWPEFGSCYFLHCQKLNSVSMFRQYSCVHMFVSSHRRSRSHFSRVSTKLPAIFSPWNYFLRNLKVSTAV